MPSPNVRPGLEPRLLPVVRPGVDQPPPGRGDGARESDMGEWPGVGVAGTGERCVFGTDELMAVLSGIISGLTAEERRRWCDTPGADEGATLKLISQ